MLAEVLFVTYCIMFVLCFTFFFALLARRPLRVKAGLVMLPACAILSLGAIFQILFPDYSTMLFLYYCNAISFMFIITSFIVFTMEFTGICDPRNKRILLAVLIVPIISLIILLSDPWLHLFNSSHQLLYVNDHEVPYIMFASGIGNLIWSAFCYIAAIYFGLILAVHLYRKYERMIYAIYLIGFLLTIFLNLASSFISSLNVMPIDGLSFTLAALFFYGTAFAYGLFELAPITRKRMLDMIQDAIIVIDPRGQLSDANRRGQEVIGMGREKFIGQPFEEVAQDLHEIFPLLGPDKKAHALSEIKINGGVHYEVEIIPFKYGPVSQNGMMIILHDITERKMIEMTLRKVEAQKQVAESEKRYRVVVESTSNSIFILNKENQKIIDMNPAFLKMTGYSPEDVNAMSITDLLVPPKEWSEVMLDQPGIVVQEGDGQFIHANGSVMDMDMSRADLNIEGQMVECYIARDVTEKRRAQREKEALLKDLARANERFEITLSSITDGVLTLDRSDNIILANRAAEEITGIKGESILGLNIKEVLNLSDENWGMIASMGSGGPIMTEIEDQNCHKRHIEFSFAITRDLQEDPFGPVFVFKDVSERRRAEIAEANADRLKTIGTLAGGIAHDFNNILTSVVGELYLLRGEIENSSVAMKRSKDRIDEMEIAMDRGKFVAQELLALSKGGAPIKKPAKIKDMVEDTAKLAFSGSKMRWNLNCPDDIWPVNIDSGQMNRVFLNIYFNAQEANTSGGTMDIVICNYQGAPPGRSEGNFVVLEFIDDGSGIPPEVLPKIFDPYFTTKERGTGLGMPIIYSTVDRHGGVVEVSSEVGNGTKVTIYIPAAEEGVEYYPLPEKTVSGYGRILIMDDEEAILEITGEVLHELGYEVDTVRDGKEALERYREAMNADRRYDVVIMDLTIKGGMGGKETIALLLKMDPTAKAIVSSGYSNDPVMANFREHGFVSVVPKPYSIEELSHTLRDVLEGELSSEV